MKRVMEYISGMEHFVVLCMLDTMNSCTEQFPLDTEQLCRWIPELEIYSPHSASAQAEPGNWTDLTALVTVI